VQVYIEYTYGQLHTFIQGSPAKIVAPIHWNPDQPQKNSLAVCVIAQQYSSFTFLSLCFHYSRKNRRVFKNVVIQIFYVFKLRTSEIVYPLLLTEFKEIRFSGKIFENVQISNAMKIRLVGAESFHGDRRT
jgi:hypothetical protein